MSAIIGGGPHMKKSDPAPTPAAAATSRSILPTRPVQPSKVPLGRSIHSHHQRCPSSPPFPRLPAGHCRPVDPFSFQWGKCLLQVLAQSGLIRLYWQQVVPTAGPGLPADIPLRQQGVRHHYTALQGEVPQHCLGRRQLLTLPGGGCLSQHRPAPSSIGRHQMHPGYLSPMNPPQGLAVQG